MSKKNIIILIISILIFIVALALYIYASSLSKNNQKISTNSVSNKITTTSNSENTDKFYFYDIDGKKVSLEDFSDKPNVLLFWKSDNSDSYEIISLIEKYYNNYKDTINFLTINVNEPDLDLKIVENVKAANFKIPIYFDTDLTAEKEYNLEKLPHLIFMKQNGEIDNQISETITEDAFTASLDLLIENY